MSIKVTQQRLPVPYLPESLRGLRVAHLTDFHRCYLTPDSLIKEAVASTNKLCPDMIVMTGDYVYRAISDIPPCAEMLAPLKADVGVFGILGNHDYYADGQAMHDALQANGVTMLLNRNVRISEGLCLAGLDDDLDGTPNIEQAFHGVQKDEPVLTLIHNPRLVKRLPDRPMIALAGHTHGGQVVLPLVTAWKLRHIGAEDFRSGWYNNGYRRLYVNRGIGNAGVPFRFGSPPEIALFTLEPSQP